MKKALEDLFLDAIAEPGELLHVETQPDPLRPGSVILYIHCSGKTVVRISRIHQNNITIDS